MTACGTVDERLQVAAATQGETEATKELPPYPTDCRLRERSGVRIGEPLDVALIRTDQALGRANARARRCGQWYDKIKIGFAGGEGD
ncbi:hypothetical protein [Roseibium sp. SCP14]|uniref:hypothetical protein n=1 Tax=Roseibium sp. SCP14 TaxID=3141375 RepID=UPI0033396D47